MHRPGRRGCESPRREGAPRRSTPARPWWFGGAGGSHTEKEGVRAPGWGARWLSGHRPRVRRPEAPRGPVRLDPDCPLGRPQGLPEEGAAPQPGLPPGNSRPRVRPGARGHLPRSPGLPATVPRAPWPARRPFCWTFQQQGGLLLGRSQQGEGRQGRALGFSPGGGRSELRKAPAVLVRLRTRVGTGLAQV